MTSITIDTGDSQIEYHHYKISTFFSENLSWAAALSTKCRSYARVSLVEVPISFSIS